MLSNENNKRKAAVVLSLAHAISSTQNKRYERHTMRICVKRIIFLILTIILTTFGVAFAQSNDESYIVKLKQDDAVHLFSEDLQKIPYTDDLYLVDELEAEALKTSGLAEYVTQDYDVELFDTPNDTYFDNQWSLNQWGYEDVYEKKLTGKGVRIGIIDSGVYSEHPDLQGNISDESFNILSWNNNVEDEYGHGTFVSGIIGAVTDNQTGIAGIAPEAEIIMIKCFEGKTTKISYIISAFNYAALLDLDVLNLSFGVQLSSMSKNLEPLREAVDAVYNSGATIVAAVGNDGDSALYYPAAFDNVLGIGSVDESLNCSADSQYNSSVFVTAPGENIYGLCSPDLDGGQYYKIMSGTSFAAPYVAANIALIKEIMPDISFEDLCMYLKLSSKDKGDEGYDIYYGWGVLNPKVLMDHILGGTKVYAAQTSMNYDENSRELHLSYNMVNNSNHEMVFIHAIYEDGVLKQTYESAFSDEVILQDVTLTDNMQVKCYIWNSLTRMQTFYRTLTFQ